jgi:hypothetical protein
MHPDDAKLLKSFKSAALVSWVLAVLVGGASVVARLLGYTALGEWLLLSAYLPGAAFVVCIVLQGISLLIFIATRGGRRGGPN